MWTKTLAATVGLLFGGSIMVLAQQAPQPELQSESKGRLKSTGIAELLIGLKPSADDMHALSEARLAALHANLFLDVDQEKYWPAFEQAFHSLAKLRAGSHATAADSGQSLDPVQQIRHRALFLASRTSALEQLANALSPLYQRLDDGQKHRFAKFSRFMTQVAIGRLASPFVSER